MTTSHTHETQIVADPDVPLVRIVREFDAPREKVFRAHTDPELVVQWQGPRGTEARIDHYDCRTGGSYRYVHTHDGAEYGFHGCFHEVRSPEVIVQTFTFEGFPDDVALERLVLEDAGLVSRTREAQRRPVHLEAQVFDLMTKWIERYRRQAEERYSRLDAVLRTMPDDVTPTAPPEEGTPS